MTAAICRQLGAHVGWHCRQTWSEWSLGPKEPHHYTSHLYKETDTNLKSTEPKVKQTRHFLILHAVKNKSSSPIHVPSGGWYSSSVEVQASREAPEPVPIAARVMASATVNCNSTCLA